MLDFQTGPAAFDAIRTVPARCMLLRILFMRLLGPLSLLLLSASAEGCQQFAVSPQQNASQAATQSPQFAPRQFESATTKPLETEPSTPQNAAPAMTSQRRRIQSVNRSTSKQTFDSFHTNNQNSVQPAAAQFPDRSGTADPSAPRQVFRSELMGEHNPDRLPGSWPSSACQDEVDIYEMNRARPKIASERVVDLTDENFYLRALLKKRDAENRALQDELARSRATIISANRAVNNSVRQIDELQQSLTARDEQLQQMHLLIKEHEQNTADRLKRLTNTIRQTIEQEMKSRDQPNSETQRLIPDNYETEAPGAAAPELLAPPNNSAKAESRVPKGTR